MNIIQDDGSLKGYREPAQLPAAVEVVTPATMRRLRRAVVDSRRLKLAALVECTAIIVIGFVTRDWRIAVLVIPCFTVWLRARAYEARDIKALERAKGS